MTANAPLKKKKKKNAPAWIVAACDGENGRHFADDISKCISLNEIFQFQIDFHLTIYLKVQPMDNHG